MTGVWRMLGAAEEEYEPEQLVEYPARRRRGRHDEDTDESAQIINMPGAETDASLCVFRPEMEGSAPGFSMRQYAAHLLARKPLILDVGELAGVDLEEATRVVDYLSGVCEAVNGTVYEMAKNIFVFLPSNIELIGDSLKQVEVY